jgi:MFS family permease
MRSMSRSVRLTLAGCAFLALADTGVVALALPPILRELDTTVTGVAAVLGVYAIVLAAALPVAELLRRRAGVRTVGTAGVGLFVLGSLVSGLAGALGLLLAARAVQAVGGAGVLVAAYALLSADAVGVRLWRAAALIGTATGPALGGALTQAFGWRSIFLLQAPAALAALPACLAAGEPVPVRTLASGTARAEVDGEAGMEGAPPVTASVTASDADRHASDGGPLEATALALLSGALAASLFLTVLLLVSGWSVEPLAAAAVVSVVPLAGIAGSRIAGPAALRALAGCLLAAGGSAALAFLPGASVLWTVLPLALVGVGMGLALPALAGDLLPERNSRQAARLLSVRHVGIAFVLAVLALIAQHQLDTQLETTREQGAALILDAQIDPTIKLQLAPALGLSVQTEDPRGGLDKVFADGRNDVGGDQLAAYDDLQQRADETLVQGVIAGFKPAYLAGAALALLAALALVAEPRTRSRLLGALRAGDAVAGVALVIALALPLGYAAVAAGSGPDEVQIADPCQQRDLPDTGGLTGLVQDAALQTLDRVACKAGSSREELVLALVDGHEADRYKRRYGTDPRSVIDLSQLILGG